jgi:nicotinamidase-related amidase
MSTVTVKSPTRRALLVVDVQNEYVTGNLRIAYPDVNVALANIGRAMDAAHAASIPVVVVQNTAPPGAPLFDHGSHGWQLHEVVSRRARIHTIEKRLPSAFAGTDLTGWLVENDIDTLTVVGFMTHNCDDSTIRHAMHAGFACEFLVDAAGSVPYANRAGAASAEEIHRVFSVVLQSRFAAVMSTSEWLHAVTTGEPPVRDTIHASHQRALAASTIRQAA